MLDEKPPTDKHTAIYHELLYIAGLCKVIPEENPRNITTITYYFYFFFIKTLTVEAIENSQEK
jgi:hypothetical protein